jgi:cation transport ATPase
VEAKEEPTSEEAGDEEAAERRREIRDLSRRVLVGAALTAPVLAAVMASEFFDVRVPDVLMNRWVQLALITPVFLYTGWPIHTTGWRTLRHRTAEMNTLITVGTTAAFAYSLLITVAPSVVPAEVEDVYYEAVGVILTLILLGRLFEAKAKAGTGEAIRKLLGLRPRTARVVRDGAEQEIPADEVRVGDEIVVRPRREAPGRRGDPRGALDDRRVHDHRRVHPRGQGSRGPGGRRNGEPDRVVPIPGDGRRVGRRLLEESGADTAPLEAVASRLEEQGMTAMYAAIDGQPAGVVAVADTAKEDAARAVAALRDRGLEVVMITGDNPRTAEAIARQVGIGRVLAEVLPQDKALSAGFSRRGGSWRWWGTGSTTPRRSPRRMLAWPSAPGPMWPSRRPTSP